MFNMQQKENQIINAYRALLSCMIKIDEFYKTFKTIDEKTKSSNKSRTKLNLI